MRLDPAHEKRHDQQYEQAYRQDDAKGQEFNRAVCFVAVLDEGEHAGGEADDNQQQYYQDDGFDHWIEDKLSDQISYIMLVLNAY